MNNQLYAEHLDVAYLMASIQRCFPLVCYYVNKGNIV